MLNKKIHKVILLIFLIIFSFSKSDNSNLLTNFSISANATEVQTSENQTIASGFFINDAGFKLLLPCHKK